MTYAELKEAFLAEFPVIYESNANRDANGEYMKVSQITLKKTRDGKPVITATLADKNGRSEITVPGSEVQRWKQ